MLVWNTTTNLTIGKPIVSPDPEDTIGVVRYRPDGDALAVGTAGGHLLLADPTTGAVLDDRSIGVPVNGIAFSPDGQRVALALEGGRVSVLDAGRDREVASLPADQFSAFDAAFSPDGAVLATGGAEGQLMFWDTTTWRRIGKPVAAHAGFVLAVGFDRSGRTLVTSSTDGTAKLWDVASHRQIGAALPGPANTPAIARWAPDAERVAVLYLNGQGFLWYAKPSDWKIQACQVAGRNLTRDEWNDVLPDRPYEPVCPAS